MVKSLDTRDLKFLGRKSMRVGIPLRPLLTDGIDLKHIIGTDVCSGNTNG